MTHCQLKQKLIQISHTLQKYAVKYIYCNLPYVLSNSHISDKTLSKSILKISHNLDMSLVNGLWVTH